MPFVFLLAAFSSVILLGCGSAEQSSLEKASCSGSTSSAVALNPIPLGNASLGNMSGHELAQSITPLADISVRFVDLMLIAVGNPSSNGIVTLQIQGDSNGSPDGGNIATAFLQVSLISNNVIRAQRFGVGSIKLLANKRYWLRLSTNLPVNNNAYIAWGGSSGNLFNLGSAAFTMAANNWNNTNVGSGFSGADFDFAFSLTCQ